MGRGALVKCGEFWYPVRLIQKIGTNWTVQWWRGIQFLPNSHVVAGGISLVAATNIVDSLWLDRSIRRMTRVRKLTSFKGATKF